jgi:hypothetical protein
MGRFTVQGIALGIQIAQALQWISHLQQGTAFVMPQAPKQVIWRRIQIDHLGSAMQVLAIFRPQHRAPTRRQNGSRALRKFVDDRRFQIAKADLPLALEILTDRAAQALLYHVVRIKKGKLQPPGELPPDGGFA